MAMHSKPSVCHVPESASVAPVISIRALKTHCQACSLSQLCLPVAFTIEQMDQFDALVVHRAVVRKNGRLYRSGAAFHWLYAIRSGSLKTVVSTESGHEQVTGFHMSGEIVGFDGIATDAHAATAIGLEDTEVCALPFSKIEKLAQVMPALQHNLHHFMSSEMGRDQNVMLMLGSMNATERIAAFLLDLADRYRRRGFSATEFNLRMTRAEIGSYLGLKLETVSRLLTRLQADGIIQVIGRSVKLLDTVTLKRLLARAD